MKNKLQDLNNHLFAQLEKISDEELTPEQLQQEIARSKAISDLSGQIIDGYKTTIEAFKVADKLGLPISEDNDIKKLL